MAVDAHAAPSEVAQPDLLKITFPYQRPTLRKALWQVADTLIPYVLLWYLMVRTVQSGYPYGVTLALAVIAAAFLTRTFVIFRDCTRSAFFASRRANTALGYTCGILTFTPYGEWRRTHAVHHATVADLDRKRTGDVWTMTVAVRPLSIGRSRKSLRLNVFDEQRGQRGAIEGENGTAARPEALEAAS